MMASKGCKAQAMMLGCAGIVGSLLLGGVGAPWGWSLAMAAALALLMAFFLTRSVAHPEPVLAATSNDANLERIRQLEERIATDRALVESLTIGIASLANGDTSYRITRDFSGEDKKLKDDFNAAIERLADVFVDIAVSAGDIDTMARNIASGAVDLSSRVDDQAANLEQTAAAMEQVSGTIRTNADNAQQTSSLAALMSSSAQAGTQAVTDAVGAMAAIQKSAEQISQIVVLVDEIAFQTNLLALNAAVEAARAGEIGKGFAVVASEVRGLAQRSSQASRSIKDLISTSTAQVGDGVRLVHAAGERLAEIVDEINKVTGLMAQISTASHEQTQAIDEVKTAVVDLETATQQNAHLAQSSSTASDALLKQADALRHLIAFFDTGGKDQVFIDLVRASAAEVSQTLEQAVASGAISTTDLFDEQYQPIANTNPVQHMTRFVSLTDRVLGPLQQRILDRNPQVAFCCAVDRNGYLPTHNKGYCEPQSSDPVWNAAHCRNRRIFNDLVGLAAGRNTKPYRLQTYQRDMGGGTSILMKDVSAPIIVQGRHWGGLRIGFKNNA